MFLESWNICIFNYFLLELPSILLHVPSLMYILFFTTLQVPRMEKRVLTVAKLGYKMCVVPKSAEKSIANLGFEGMEIVGCKNLKEVINTVFKAWWTEVGNYSAIFCTLGWWRDVMPCTYCISYCKKICSHVKILNEFDMIVFLWSVSSWINPWWCSIHGPSKKCKMVHHRLHWFRTSLAWSQSIRGGIDSKICSSVCPTWCLPLGLNMICVLSL